jgi:hypothetical protein
MLSQRSLGAAKKVSAPSDDEFNRVSFKSSFEGANNGVNNSYDDGSTSNHTITANGNVTQGSFGPFARPDGEWGWSFDGVGDYIQTAASSDFQFGTGDFTVEMWVFPTDIGMNTSTGSYGGGVIDFREANSATTAFGCHLKTDSKIDMYTNTQLAEGGSVNGNAWNHLALVRISNVIKGYVNGVQAFSFSNSTNFSSGRVTIASNIPHNNDFQGSVSNVRVVKGTGVYTGAFTPPTSPLTAISGTVLLTCQSNRFVDNSTSAHTVTPTGNAAVSAFGPFLTDAVYDPAVNGGSAYFDGTGDYLSFSHASDFAFGTGDFTIEFWSWGGVGNAQYIYQGSTASAAYHHLIESNGTIMRYYPTAGSNPMHDTGWGAITNNAWTHYAVARTSGTTNLYKNGVRVLTASGSPSNNNFQSTIIRIGAATHGSGWLGYITDFRVVKGTAVYTGTTYTIPTAPLTAITNTKLLLNMQDGQAIDSAAQNNLTLTDDVKLSTAKAKFGDTSMLFDGSGRAYIQGSNVLDFGAGDFTVEMFVNVTAFSSSYPTLLDARNSNDVEGPMFSLFLNDDDKFAYFANNTTQITAGSAASANTWYHVAVCRSGTSTKLFIDGTQAGSTYSDSTVYTQPNDHCLLGGYYNSVDYDFNGYFDEVRISKMARYTNNFTAPTEPFADKGQ